MEPRTIELAKASLHRCQATDGFIDAFYREFFRICPPAEQRFANTDLEVQHKLLQHGLGLLLNYASQEEADPLILERLAERHSRTDLAVDPPLYDLFLEALITTIGEFDQQYTAEIGDAWREAVKPGVEYMKSKY